ncbi:uncharacterized protein E6C27_scaffold318G001050 [Cucumis melo var. makuwa]|uniref:Uncharacterized protein n=1 Tax=Cucumis melo var. makuwa TaxID=1194695 RepID=A0A5A7UKG2_CUCMM|nr:uncharacterized protein E6C27_scaffold318G001050 [Cucumis melo var. makuwa]
MGEEDFLITKPVSTPYVEATEEALECSFRSFEIAHATMMEAIVDEVIKPHKFKVEVMTTRITGGGGYSLNQNLETLLKILSNDGRFGLGYKPSIYDKIRLQEEKKEKFIAVSQEASFEGNTVYACPSDFELNNWDIVDLPTFSRDFQEMVEEEDEVLRPHQELVEAINLGSQEESKEDMPGLRYNQIKFKDLKAVPWRYDCKVITGRKNEKRNVKEHCKDQDVEMPIIAKDIEYKKLVTDEEANEFFKIVKQEPHRKVLLDILNKAHVGHDISVEKFSGIIRNITYSNSIVFTDDEIPPKGLGHIKALHIQVKCKNYVIARVLVDNGSALNIMSKSTLLKLLVDMSHIKSSTMVVKAFDGSRREVIGRPWIHSAGVVPSTLHQKLKFIVGSKLICVMGEEDFLITKPVSTPYVEATEEALECSFRSFEIVHATMMEATVDEVIKPHKFKVEVMTTRIMGDNIHKNEDVSNPGSTLDALIYTMESDKESDDEDDVGISSELLRMVEEEDEVLGPHQELVEAINLGSQEESKEDMPGLSTDIVVHRVPLKPECNPVRQKLRKMKLNVLIKIKEEVQKQIEAGFLTVSKYPEWVTNIVPVPKKDRKDTQLSPSWMIFQDIIRSKWLKKIEKKRHSLPFGKHSAKKYDIVYVTKKAIKGSAIADHLAAQPVADYEPMRIDFPDENIFRVEKNARDHETWTMLFDGASNELGHGIGVVLISPEGKVFPLTAKLCFECTHNIAEYKACIMGLQVACDMSIKKLKVLGDSMLVIHQVKEEWETRDAKLVPYSQYVTKLSQNFEKISFDHVPREDNRIADALATLAVMFDLNLEFELLQIQITKRDVPAYCMNVGNDNKPWYFDIKQYIKCREYPYEALENDKRTIRRLAINFFLSGEVLYKRNHDMVLLRCVDKEKAKQIMTDIHEGICGTHANGHMMARQILRSGYYWTTMESDCIKYARECKKCQIYMDKIHVAASSLHILSAPWSFSLWGMDVIGAIDPKASNGHRFILVAIDYFTKWIEAASYCNVTRGVMLKFIKKELICRYGLLEGIITDNAKNLNNKMMDELCEQFKINHRNSTPYRSKMNEAVEAANKNIKRIIEKMTITYQDWHEMLPFALHGYRTSVRTSTGATPFSLVYGMEAVLPLEVEIPSLRVLMEAKKWSIPDAEEHVGIKNVGNKGFPDALNNASEDASGKPSFLTHHEGVGKNTSGKGVFSDAVNSPHKTRLNYKLNFMKLWNGLKYKIEITKH